MLILAKNSDQLKQQSKRDEANRADRKPSFVKRNGKFKIIYKNFKIKKSFAG